MKRFMKILYWVLKILCTVIAAVLALAMGFFAFLNFRAFFSGDASVLTSSGHVLWNAFMMALVSVACLIEIFFSFGDYEFSYWVDLIIIGACSFLLFLNVIPYIGPELAAASTGATIGLIAATAMAFGVALLSYKGRS